MNIQQSFLLASGIWVVFPFFAALPFWFGSPHASFTDAFFEAMSGLTTTGATVFVGLDEMPAGHAPLARDAPMVRRARDRRRGDDLSSDA